MSRVGYLRGVRAAAAYCGIGDRKTFIRWCREHDVRPRLIGGQAYFAITALDAMMDPDQNPPGSLERFYDTAASPGKSRRPLIAGPLDLRGGP